MNMTMDMGGSASMLDTAGALLLLVWAVVMWAAVGLLWVASRRPVPSRLFAAGVAVIGLGVAGQIGHVQEHIAQAGIWVACLGRFERAWIQRVVGRPTVLASMLLPI